jgi:pimeloyl-[acyl-carrier protein] methyl ester esterase
MSVHVKRTGRGPRLVLLHGWGLNSRVWDGVLPALTDRFELECIDLPGHGASDWPASITDLDSLAAAIAPLLRNPCAVLGWSLGALIALHLAAHHSAGIERLVLVAATPKFVADESWSPAMKPAVLEQFAAQLAQDHRGTVQKFLALQVRGDEHAHGALRTLRRRVLAAGDPDPRALRVGLDVLREADLRTVLPDLRVPTLVIAGERDVLVPAAASEALARCMPLAESRLIRRAAHAPFLSHADEFCDAVGDFLDSAKFATAERAS